MKRAKTDDKTFALIVIPPIVLAVIVAVVLNILAFKWSDPISKHFGHSTYIIESSDGAASDVYYSPDYADLNAAMAASERVAYDICAEGMVLLKNDTSDGGGLPLKKGADGSIKVSCFSASSVNVVYGGTGSGAVDSSSAPNVMEAFAYAGISVNPELWSFYKQKNAEGYKRTLPNRWGSSFGINEVPWEQVSPVAAQTYKDYSDAAVVFLARTGCEGSDLPAYGFEETAAVAGNSGNYLELTREETDMLLALGQLSDNIIVVVNSNNPMELGALNDMQNISAVLWCGGFGSSGLYALADALVGNISPSGRLTDTYAYSALSSPAMANGGTNFYIENYPSAAPYADEADQYLVELEGIYVGYRYYETRYEDCVTGSEGVGGFDYSAEVLYPFGYGLSYTSFVYDDFSVEYADGKFVVGLTVLNSGGSAGKDVVQIYVRSPYTAYDISHGIEKSSVVLAGFAKTRLLEPGDSQTVEITFDERVLASYDGSDGGAYLIERGDYYIAFGRNARNALNNMLGKMGYGLSDGMTEEGNSSFAAVYSYANDVIYDTSPSGERIGNAFTSADIRSYPDGEGVEYLSRSNWTKTWPAPFADRRDASTGEMYAEFSSQLIAGLAPQRGGEGEVESGGRGVGKEGLNLATLIGADYQSEAWYDFLDMLTEEQLIDIVCTGGFGNSEITSLNVPSTNLKDGPAGLSGRSAGTAFPNSVVLASSWNTALAGEMGRAVGNEALFLGVHGWYAPAVNIHRTPFGGRNFEYYSEDGRLSGEMAAAMVGGAQSKGLVCYVKHFALNDTEAVNDPSNGLGGSKDGLATFACEQAIREIYLVPFEYAVTRGGAMGVMNSFNRIGTVWSGDHDGLQNGILRGEWGFKGCVITDMVLKDYMDISAGLKSGTDAWMNSDKDAFSGYNAQLADELLPYVRQAAHRVLYVIANSAAMNGISADSRMVPVMPLWQKWLIAADVGVALLAAAGIVAVAIRHKNYVRGK